MWFLWVFMGAPTVPRAQPFRGQTITENIILVQYPDFGSNVGFGCSKPCCWGLAWPPVGIRPENCILGLKLACGLKVTQARAQDGPTPKAQDPGPRG